MINLSFNCYIIAFIGQKGIGVNSREYLTKNIDEKAQLLFDVGTLHSTFFE